MRTFLYTIYILTRQQEKFGGQLRAEFEEFTTTGFKITTGEIICSANVEISTTRLNLGCTNHPAPGQKFCQNHEGHTSPVLTPTQLSAESLKALNSQHTNRERFLMTGLERDNIFIIEGKASFVKISK